MSITPQPGSGPPRRLTARERQELKEIETALVRSDPGLGTRLSRSEPTEKQSTIDRVVQIVVLLVLCALVLPGPWVVALFVLCGVGTVAFVALRTVRAGGSGA